MVKDLLLWLYWHPFRRLIQLLAPGNAYRMARVMGAGVALVARGKTGRLAREYHAVAGDGAPPAAATRAARRAIVNFLYNELDVLIYPLLNPANIARMVRLEGQEHLEAALAQGRGVMLLFGHFGANQMVMPAVGHRGYAMSQLSAPPPVWVEKMPNRHFSPTERACLQLRWEHEQALPVNHISVFGSLKPAFSCLKKNGVLGIAIDGGGGKERVAVEFMGGVGIFSTGALQIALRTGCVVLPTFMVRDGAGFSAMIVEPPLPLLPAAQDGVRLGVARFAARLEEYVKRYPCHYLNFMALRRMMGEMGDDPFLVADLAAAAPWVGEPLQKGAVPASD